MAGWKYAVIAHHVRGQVQDVDGPSPGGFYLERGRDQADDQIQPDGESQRVLEGRRKWRSLFAIGS